MKNIEYWKKRALLIEDFAQHSADDYINMINNMYLAAFSDIELKIKKIEDKLNRTKLDIEPKVFRIRRYRKLQKEITEKFVNISAMSDKLGKELLKSVIRDSYLKSVFDIQVGVGLGFKVKPLSVSRIDVLLNEKWNNGNFSSRVWKNNANIAKNAHEIISSGFTSLGSIADMSVKLKRLQNTSYYVAERLIRTETNYFSNKAKLLSLNASGIKKYRFIATLDLRTSKLCQVYDGRIFKISYAKVGFNYPPLHPNCRSVVIAHFDGDTLEGMQRRARDENGKQISVSADMNYANWFKKFVSV